MLASICAAYVEVNDYAAADLPLLRQRMQLILTEPALLAHSQLRYADVDRVVAEHVAARTGGPPGDCSPGWSRPAPGRRRPPRSRRGWPTPRSRWTGPCAPAFDELAAGFPAHWTRAAQGPRGSLGTSVTLESAGTAASPEA